MERIIPASAGQTTAATHAQRRNTDHPRECGANISFFTSTIIITGSSPRVRGKHMGHGIPRYCTRIIPASAGQTPARHVYEHPETDHPRECGANTPRSAWLIFRVGSSPRVRGKPYGHTFLAVELRIIPASAGQTGLAIPFFAAMADHPRECGANMWYSIAVVAFAGSSPRVRGKQSGFTDKSYSAHA